MAKKIVCLTLVILLIAGLCGCSNNEYRTAKSLISAVSHDQIRVDSVLKVDANVEYMKELSNTIDPEYLSMLSDIMENGLYAKCILDNYNGEYEIELSTKSTSSLVITTIRSVKTGLYVNIKQLSNYLKAYKATTVYGENLDEIMVDKEWIRYNYFTNLNKTKYSRLMTTAGKIIYAIDKAFYECSTATRIKDKTTVKIKSENSSNIKSAFKKALLSRGIGESISGYVQDYINYLSDGDVNDITNGKYTTKKEAKDIVRKNMVKYFDELKGSYADKINDFFSKNTYLELIYTDSTYYSNNTEEFNEDDELCRLEVYNYGEDKNKKDIIGNKNYKLSLVSTLYILDDEDTDVKSYYDSNKLGKQVVSPSGALNADIVAKSIKDILDKIDYKIQNDSIEVEVGNYGGSKSLIQFDGNDEEMYTKEKLLPLRRIGSQIGLDVIWDEVNSRAGVKYQTASGNYIFDYDIESKLVGDTTYMSKDTIEKLAGITLVIENGRVYKEVKSE